MSFRPTNAPRWLAMLAFAVPLIVYLALPTKIYYGDGIGFANDIEAADADPALLFQPNHLLYNAFGYGTWTVARVFQPQARPLDVLQATNSFIAAASAGLLFCILFEGFKSRYIALCLSFAFAFSSTWWKFSTDVDSYIPSVSFLLASLWLISPSRQSRPAMLALAHTAAMLLHQLALLFFPAALVGLWLQTRGHPLKERLVILGQYSTLAGLLTLIAYVFAFHFSRGALSLGRITSWMSSHSVDSSFSFRVGQNLAKSVAGNVKLFVGGRLPFIREAWGSFILVSAVVTIGLLAMLIWQMKKRGLPKLRWPDRRFAPLVLVCVVWIATYVPFLVFWLPQNTFYRLFYLPALILLAGVFIASSKTQTRSLLALGVGILFCFNLGFSIYPAAQPALNRTVLFATSMRDVWRPGTTIYWNVYAGENPTIKYFNPQVTWKELWDRAPIEEMSPILQASSASGGSLWFDLATLRRFSAQDPAFSDWLRMHCRLGETHQFRNTDDIVGFVKLVPLN